MSYAYITKWRLFWLVVGVSAFFPHNLYSQQHRSLLQTCLDAANREETMEVGAAQRKWSWTVTKGSTQRAMPLPYIEGFEQEDRQIHAKAKKAQLQCVHEDTLRREAAKKKLDSETAATGQ